MDSTPDAPLPQSGFFCAANLYGLRCLKLESLEELPPGSAGTPWPHFRDHAGAVVSSTSTSNGSATTFCLRCADTVLCCARACPGAGEHVPYMMVQRVIADLGTLARVEAEQGRGSGVVPGNFAQNFLQRVLDLMTSVSSTGNHAQSDQAYHEACVSLAMRLFSLVVADEPPPSVWRVLEPVAWAFAIARMGDSLSAFLSGNIGCLFCLQVLAESGNRWVWTRQPAAEDEASTMAQLASMVQAGAVAEAHELPVALQALCLEALENLVEVSGEDGLESSLLDVLDPGLAVHLLGVVQGASDGGMPEVVGSQAYFDAWTNRLCALRLCTMLVCIRWPHEWFGQHREDSEMLMRTIKAQLVSPFQDGHAMALQLLHQVLEDAGWPFRVVDQLLQEDLPGFLVELLRQARGSLAEARQAFLACGGVSEELHETIAVSCVAGHKACQVIGLFAKHPEFAPYVRFTMPVVCALIVLVVSELDDEIEHNASSIGFQSIALVESGVSAVCSLMHNPGFVGDRELDRLTEAVLLVVNRCAAAMERNGALLLATLDGVCCLVLVPSASEAAADAAHSILSRHNAMYVDADMCVKVCSQLTSLLARMPPKLWGTLEGIALPCMWAEHFPDLLTSVPHLEPLQPLQPHIGLNALSYVQEAIVHLSNELLSIADDADAESLPMLGSPQLGQALVDQLLSWPFLQVMGRIASNNRGVRSLVCRVVNQARVELPGEGRVRIAVEHLGVNVPITLETVVDVISSCADSSAFAFASSSVIGALVMLCRHCMAQNLDAHVKEELICTVSKLVRRCPDALARFPAALSCALWFMAAAEQVWGMASVVSTRGARPLLFGCCYEALHKKTLMFISSPLVWRWLWSCSPTDPTASAAASADLQLLLLQRQLLSIDDSDPGGHSPEQQDLPDLATVADNHNLYRSMCAQLESGRHSSATCGILLQALQTWTNARNGQNIISESREQVLPLPLCGRLIAAIASAAQQEHWDQSLWLECIALLLDMAVSSTAWVPGQSMLFPGDIGDADREGGARGGPRTGSCQTTMNALTEVVVEGLCRSTENGNQPAADLHMDIIVRLASTDGAETANLAIIMPQLVRTLVQQHAEKQLYGLSDVSWRSAAWIGLLEQQMPQTGSSLQAEEAQGLFSAVLWYLCAARPQRLFLSVDMQDSMWLLLANMCRSGLVTPTEQQVHSLFRHLQTMLSLLVSDGQTGASVTDVVDSLQAVCTAHARTCALSTVVGLVKHSWSIFLLESMIQADASNNDISEATLRYFAFCLHFLQLSDSANQRSSSASSSSSSSDNTEVADQTSAFCQALRDSSALSHCQSVFTEIHRRVEEGSRRS